MNEVALLQAVKDVIREKIQDHPAININVDMQPIADAIDRMTDILNEVLVTLSKQLPPNVDFKPIIKVPETIVNVAAPEVTVQVPEPRGQERTLTIEHSDGTTSIVKEKIAQEQAF